MTQQVDFYNAFIQATIAEEVYVDLPVMISDDNNDDGKYGVVLKLNKSLYGLVQAPRSWYQHLHKDLETLDFKLSKLDL